jgi:hypothetical protein
MNTMLVANGPAEQDKFQTVCPGNQESRVDATRGVCISLENPVDANSLGQPAISTPRSFWRLTRVLFIWFLLISKRRSGLLFKDVLCTFLSSCCSGQHAHCAVYANVEKRKKGKGKKTTDMVLLPHLFHGVIFSPFFPFPLPHVTLNRSMSMSTPAAVFFGLA